MSPRFTACHGSPVGASDGSPVGNLAFYLSILFWKIKIVVAPGYTSMLLPHRSSENANFFHLSLPTNVVDFKSGICQKWHLPIWRQAVPAYLFQLIFVEMMQS